MKHKGIFITFEGPEGSGKTTIIDRITEYFNLNNTKYIATREPGGSKIAEEIRDIILCPSNTSLCANAEALLYAASRAQHFEEKIAPALEQGAIVLCDRFIDSSLVYQGIARGLGIDNIYEINRLAIKDTLPDITFFFDISPRIGLERIHKNKDREVNRLDLEKIEFHDKVYEGYQTIIEKYHDRFVIIDASQTIEQVFKDTITKIEEMI